jgi:hypothetical protein
MLKAYLDESGSDDTPALLIAGYLSTETRWKAFERDWVKALQSEGLGESFHMVDFETGSGQFRGPAWTEQRKERLFRRLAEIISQNVMFEVAVGLRVPDFKEALSLRDKHLNHNLSTPYALCVLHCIVFISHWARKNWRKEEVAIVFDQGRKFTGEILQWYRRAALSGELRERHKIASIGVGLRGVAIPLQAADVLAHLTFRAYKTRTTQGFTDPVVAKRLLCIRHVKAVGGMLDRRAVGWWLDSLNSQFFTKLLKNR